MPDLAGRRRWRRRWMTARIALAGALWPVPALGVVTAIVLGVAMRSVDRSLQAAGAGSLRFVFGGDAAAARSVLSAIASALATVTTLLLSLTIVTLQLASTQYSPRLLQDFTRDRVVQACLAVLLGTFVYSLIALRDVRSEATPTASTSVPRMSVTVAVVLAVASVGALVAFIGHQVRNLRVETMMRAVHAEASATLLRLEQRRGHGERAGQEPPAVPPGARRVLARENGFLQKVDARRLVGTLAAAGVTLRLDRRPGDTVVIGTPIGWAWPDEPERDVDLDDLEAALVEDLVVGFERIDDEDPSYGLRKLADIAVRALSPGINDPTTAVHAMSHLSALLGEAGAVDSWHRGAADRDGRARLFLCSWDYDALLELAIGQIRHYGRRDPAVARRLFELLAEVGWRARTSRQRSAVRRHCEGLTEACLREPPTGWSAEDVRRHAEGVVEALAGAGALR